MLRYLSCVRMGDVLVLQGPPLLGAAFAVGRAGANDLPRLAILMIANVLLMTHVFMLNDWSGLTTDLADPNKSARVFTARGVRRGEIAALTAAFLLGSLLLFSRLGALTLSLSLAIAALSAIYSLPPFHWKGRPFLNSVAHVAGGILHFLLGYSIGNRIDGRGVATATFFALVFAAAHLIQEIRDHDSDARNTIRTNAVVFGPRRTFAASLILFTLAHAIVLLLAFQGTVPRALAGIVVLYVMQLYWSFGTLRKGLTYSNVCRLQVRYRALYAILGLLMVAVLYTALPPRDAKPQDGVDAGAATQGAAIGG